MIKILGKGVSPSSVTEVEKKKLQRIQSLRTLTEPKKPEALWKRQGSSRDIPLKDEEKQTLDQLYTNSLKREKEKILLRNKKEISTGELQWRKSNNIPQELMDAIKEANPPAKSDSLRKSMPNSFFAPDQKALIESINNSIINKIQKANSYDESPVNNLPLKRSNLSNSDDSNAPVPQQQQQRILPKVPLVKTNTSPNPISSFSIKNNNNNNNANNNNTANNSISNNNANNNPNNNNTNNNANNNNTKGSYRISKSKMEKRDRRRRGIAI